MKRSRRRESGLSGDPVHFIENRVVQVLRHHAIAQSTEHAFLIWLTKQYAAECIDTHGFHLREDGARIVAGPTHRTSRSDSSHKVVKASDRFDDNFHEWCVRVRIVWIVILRWP